MRRRRWRPERDARLTMRMSEYLIAAVFEPTSPYLVPDHGRNHERPENEDHQRRDRNINDVKHVQSQSKELNLAHETTSSSDCEDCADSESVFAPRVILAASASFWRRSKSARTFSIIPCTNSKSVSVQIFAQGFAAQT